MGVEMRKRLKIDLYMPRLSADGLRIVGPSESDAEKQLKPTRYTIERLVGGCVVYWLSRREPGRPA
jgi:hypothetical protein